MRAREFDIKLIDADIEEFKNLLDVFRDVFDWGDHDHPDEEYLLRLTTCWSWLPRMETKWSVD